MHWEDDLFNALKDLESEDPDLVQTIQRLRVLVGTRIYPSLAPTGTPQPYIVWQEVSTQGETTHDGETGPDFPLFQFTTWAEDRNVARDVRLLLRKILEGRVLPGTFTLRATFSNQLFQFDSTSRLHGALLELRLHINNPTQIS